MATIMKDDKLYMGITSLSLQEAKAPARIELEIKALKEIPEEALKPAQRWAQDT